MAWTTVERYRRYEDWTTQELSTIKEAIQKSPWRSHYHIEPKTGLLNDPNGFSYYNGKWVLYYQNFPFGPVHGLKQWVQLESQDLVHFEETGGLVLPDTQLDSHGAYSGSAMQFGDDLFLFYTGNHRDENWVRHPYQIGALVHSDGSLEKLDKILIDQPEDATDHFRDPQIFNYKGQFYAIVGGQRKADKKGYVKLYNALNNSYQDWQEIGDLNFDNDETAYMMECPNLVFIQDQPVLLYCPQGLDKAVLDYDNIYPNTYKVGAHFDPERAEMVGCDPIENLDYGFEAYATQAFNAPDGRALAVSWLGLPDVEYPSDHYQHQGILSLVKELTLKDGKLYQNPVSEITSLRASSAPFSQRKEGKNAYELELQFKSGQVHDLLLFANEKQEGLLVRFDLVEGTVMVDRSQVGQVYAHEFGQVRQTSVLKKDTTARIFIDQSSFEIFVNEGEKVFSGRVFPDADQTGIYQLAGDIQGNYYELDYGRKTN